MSRSVRSLAFGVLILTAAARTFAQSHGKEAANAKPDVAHEAPAPAAPVKGRPASPSHGKEPAAATTAAAPEAPTPRTNVRRPILPQAKEPLPAKPGTAPEAPAPATARPASPSQGKVPGPAKPAVPHDGPAPSATARAIAQALTDARVRRKDTRAAQPGVPAVPAERRLPVIWPQPTQRVTLTWPEPRVALTWPTATEAR